MMGERMEDLMAPKDMKAHSAPGNHQQLFS
jgi:hypothetical protein